MPTTFANQINNLDIYAARAVADKDGNQLDTTYAKSSDLATVATSGSYTDLSNKPTIPAPLSAGDGVDITNNVVSAKVDGSTIDVNASGELSVVGGGQLEIVEVDDISTRFASLDAIITEMSGGKFFVFHKLYNNSHTWYIPCSYTPSTLHCTYSIDIDSVQQDFRIVDLYIQYSSVSGFNIQTSDAGGFNFQPSSTICPYIITGLDQREYVCGELVCTKDNASSAVQVYKCILTYTETQTNRKPHQDPTHWAATTLGAEIQARVPAPTTADATKVLTVDSNGNPGWATPSVPTVDQTFDGTSSNAQSGTAIAGELTNYTPTSGLATVATSGSYTDLSNTPTIRNVPASTSADEDKVLTVDSTGEPYWADPSAGLFEAIYGQTSYADIVDAVNAHKIVYCRISTTGASRMAFLAYIGVSNVEFQYYRSLSSHSASNQTDEVYVYTVSSSGWTTTTRLTGIKYAAGTHMTSSFYNNTLTFQSVWPDVDQTYDGTSTNAQSGTAIAGELANYTPTSGLATVATSGDYNDLSNTPTIPAAQVNADWDSSSGVSEILNKPTPKTLVAGTGIVITETANSIVISLA